MCFYFSSRLTQGSLIWCQTDCFNPISPQQTIEIYACGYHTKYFNGQIDNLINCFGIVHWDVLFYQHYCLILSIFRHYNDVCMCYGLCRFTISSISVWPSIYSDTSFVWDPSFSDTAALRHHPSTPAVHSSVLFIRISSGSMVTEVLWHPIVQDNNSGLIRDRLVIRNFLVLQSYSHWLQFRKYSESFIIDIWLFWQMTKLEV